MILTGQANKYYNWQLLTIYNQLTRYLSRNVFVLNCPIMHFINIREHNDRAYTFVVVLVTNPSSPHFHKLMIIMPFIGKWDLDRIY